MSPQADVRPFMSLVGKTLANDVLHRVREDILSGLLRPGEHLHFETLKTTYGASFSTLREALSRLAGEGLVVSAAQRGFAVARISVEDVQDVTQVRILVESEALKLSIERGDKTWRSSVLSAYHELDRLTAHDRPTSATWAEKHRAFHMSLIAACESPLLISLSGRLFDSAARFRRLSMGQRPYHRDKSNEHRELMEASLTGDAKSAVRMMEVHFRETSENVIAALRAGAVKDASAAVPMEAVKSSQEAIAERVYTTPRRSKSRRARSRA